jgi:hypothetical protein
MGERWGGAGRGGGEDGEDRFGGVFKNEAEFLRAPKWHFNLFTVLNIRDHPPPHALPSLTGPGECLFAVPNSFYKSECFIRNPLLPRGYLKAQMVKGLEVGTLNRPS